MQNHEAQDVTHFQSPLGASYGQQKGAILWERNGKYSSLTTMDKAPLDFLPNMNDNLIMSQLYI